ncbi:MAG: hypothetical protein COC23_05285 [Hyphomicrobiales bacterium]|nr:MAG: hypothetical protein COC23_05285 [Hyphomicrobiales bacterium]
MIILTAYGQSLLFPVSGTKSTWRTLIFDKFAIAIVSPDFVLNPICGFKGPIGGKDGTYT